MTAADMRKISESCSLRKDAIDYGIKTIEEKMTEYAKRELRECYVSFHYHPGPFKEFKEKYGDNEEYREFNVEKELREYFTGNGFTFRYVTDDICGGVRQDPYWVICW